MVVDASFNAASFINKRFFMLESVTFSCPQDICPSFPCKNLFSYEASNDQYEAIVFGNQLGLIKFFKRKKYNLTLTTIDMNSN